MKNLAFVLWMLGWPIVVNINEYLYYLTTNKVYSDETEFVSAIINLIIWIGIGVRLYEKKEKEEEKKLPKL